MEGKVRLITPYGYDLAELIFVFPSHLALGVGCLAIPHGIM
jgi:hypothetical protein